MKNITIHAPVFENCPILGQRYVGTEKRVISFIPKVARKSKKRRTQKFF